MQGATVRRIFDLRRLGRLVRDQQLRYYYVKDKKRKRGPSGQAWLALAGVTTTIAGVSIYLLGEPTLYLTNIRLLIFSIISGRPEEVIAGLDTVSWTIPLLKHTIFNPLRTSYSLLINMQKVSVVNLYCNT